jgi:hypothetical protein
MIVSVCYQPRATQGESDFFGQIRLSISMIVRKFSNVCQVMLRKFMLTITSSTPSEACYARRMEVKR